MKSNSRKVRQGFVFKQRRADRRSSLQNGLNYGSLEPRKLLATITVVDLDETPESNLETREFVAFNGGVAGVERNVERGTELWFSNSTHDGSYQIDVLPGAASSSPRELKVVDNQLFFTANDGESDRALWVTDGSESGTRKLLSSVSNYGFQGVAAFKGHLFFATNDGIHGNELWSSNGTVAGTKLFKDVFPGPDGSTPRGFAVLRNELYFITQEDGAGNLWKTDGTSAGTERLVSGIFSAYGRLHAMESSGLLFFENNLTDVLWVSDGTAAGTQMLKAFDTLDWYRNEKISIGTSLFFEADLNGSGPDLWISDGTRRGTRMLKELDARVDLHSFTDFEGSAYFAFRNFSTQQRELWQSDGTTAGTVQVPLEASISNYYGLTVLGDQIIYSGYETEFGHELFATQGTLASNKIFADINPYGGSYPFKLIENGSRIFTIVSFDKFKQRIASAWATDGIDTNQVSEPSTHTEGLRLTELTDVDGRLFAVDGSHWHANVYQSDGTLEGTGLSPAFPELHDPWQSESGLTVANEKLFLTSTDLASNSGMSELWVFDSTTNDPAYQLDVLNAGFKVASGDLVYFLKLDSYTDQHIWVTDGTNEGTRQVLQWGRHIDEFAVVDGRFYIFSNQTLYVSDGTQRGTRELDLPFAVGLIYPSPSNFTRLSDGRVLFTADQKVYVTDGTNDGTQVILDSAHGFGSNDAGQFIELDGKIFFTVEADSYSDGYQLWVTDGTVDGTIDLIQNLPRDTDLTVFNDQVFFARDEQLYKTNGTVRGTVAVSQVIMQPSSLEVFNGKLHFAGSSDDAGRELWVTDGTEAGTTIVVDHIRGPGDTDLTNLTAAGDNLFFNYDSIQSGAEIGFLTIETIHGFDFGPITTRHALSQYTRAFDQSYNPETGYGWTKANGLTSVSTSHGNNLLKDKVSLKNGTFVVDVLNGTYQVDVHLGAVRNADPIQITVEGQVDSFVPRPGPNVVRSYEATVSDGQLTLDFNGSGGLDNKIRIAGISLSSIAGRPLVASELTTLNSSNFENYVRLPATERDLTQNSIDDVQKRVMQRVVVLSLSGSKTRALDDYFASDRSTDLPTSNFEIDEAEVLLNLEELELGFEVPPKRVFS